jgi:regulator of protease activity HflC (stomatin/prohibitin superfamily)
MENCGKNGLADFKLVTGAQGPLGPCSELYQVPMFEQKGDAPELGVTTNDGGFYKVDPNYAYEAIRGKGPEIVFNYKHVNPADISGFMDNIETNILTPIILNAYREEARKFSTDELLKNLAKFELAVETRLKTEFNGKFFNLLTLSSGLRPPESMIKAIENRNNTIQQAEQARNELEIAKMELEKAKIYREKDLVKTQGLTKEILQDKWIDAIRSTNNKVIITDGKTPVIVNQQ